MQLTDPQRRTLDGLIGTGDRPTFAADLAQRLRDRIEGAARELELGEPLWFGKEKLNQHGRCEGLFRSVLAGEAPPFAHSARSAHGVLLHKAIEVEVGAREGMDPHEVAQVAVDRVLEREERFADYWRELSVCRTRRRVDGDRPAGDAVPGHVPAAEAAPSRARTHQRAAVRAELLGGDLVLSGQIDLVLGLPDRLEPNRATRLVVDLKTGSAYPEFAEDMRFYALVMTLRFGVPPYRAASLFLESGTWQAEDVTEEILQHAADRVIGAARAAASLTNGRSPELTPGALLLVVSPSRGVPGGRAPALRETPTS